MRFDWLTVASKVTVYVLGRAKASLSDEAGT